MKTINESKRSNPMLSPQLIPIPDYMKAKYLTEKMDPGESIEILVNDYKTFINYIELLTKSKIAPEITNGQFYIYKKISYLNDNKITLTRVK